MNHFRTAVRLGLTATYRAGPSLCRQSYDIVDRETTNGVLVTDAKKDKDGEAKIIAGGVGQKKGTIQMSPSMFADTISKYSKTTWFWNDEYTRHPALMVKDIKLNYQPKMEQNIEVKLEINQFSSANGRGAEEI